MTLFLGVTTSVLQAFTTTVILKLETLVVSDVGCKAWNIEGHGFRSCMSYLHRE